MTIHEILVGAATIKTLLDVSSETLRRWRKGSPPRMPYVVIAGNGNPVIVYDFVAVIEWANINRVRTYEAKALKMWGVEKTKWRNMKE